MTRTERRISKLVRRAVGCEGTPYPIVDKDGFDAPRLVGESYYWTTPSGKTRVAHPLAFARRRWPTVYHGSTLRIEVGRGWIAARLYLADDCPEGIVSDYIQDQTAVAV